MAEPLRVPPYVFSSLTGRGVTGRVDDKNVVLGNRKLLDELGVDATPLHGRTDAEILPDQKSEIVKQLLLLPIIAAAAMSFSSVSAILNALRLRGARL